MALFAGAERLTFGELSHAIKPLIPLRFPEWIERNIVLIDGDHAGQLWSRENAPYLIEPAECLSVEHPCNLVTIRKSQQTGVSILALAWALYIADQTPANTLFAVPSIDALKDMSDQKFRPLIEAWENHIKRQVIYPMTSRSDEGSSKFLKKFPGGYIKFANANSAMDLSSKTTKYGIKDEVSKWQDISGEDDPETLFFGRFTAFRRAKTYKIFQLSTPEWDAGEEDGKGAGHCRIDRAFQASDQRFWYIQCPECQDWFYQEFGKLQIDEKSPHKSKYECPHCVHHVSEAERVHAVKAGHYRAHKPDEGREPGFHIDAFVSLMMSYEAIAEDYIASENGGSKGPKGFCNLVQGLPFTMKGNAPEWKRLMERSIVYKENHLPREALMVVGGVDVQHKGLWVIVKAFGRGKKSWTITARWLHGDTTDVNEGAWKELSKLYEEEFPDVNGVLRPIEVMTVDAGDGGRASQVYTWCGARIRAQAIHGVDGWGKPAIGPKKPVTFDYEGARIKDGATLRAVGTWDLKSTFYDRLHKEGRVSGASEDPPGYCYHGDFLPDWYFKQITSEYLKETVVSGIPKQEWKPRGENHLLDCEIYALAGAEGLGLSEFEDHNWHYLEKKYGLLGDVGAQQELFSPEPVKALAQPEPKTDPEPEPEPESQLVRDGSSGGGDDWIDVGSDWIG
ncbi:MAG: phage terminase large subunit family protein [Cohaesibacter sp.]|nr:phage terminase large subunit family protein [Cohaesibacter sp.]